MYSAIWHSAKPALLTIGFAGGIGICLNVESKEVGAPLDPAKIGVAIYPGARVDATGSAVLREALEMTGTAYRTSDDVAKVVAFYDKQQGMSKMPGATREQAAFSTGCTSEFNRYLKAETRTCKYMVTVQNPWMDTRTGKLVHDTLISIVKP